MKEKNGESRLVVDYRSPNSQTERINFPLPNIDEYLEVMVGETLFATRFSAWIFTDTVSTRCAKNDDFYHTG